MRILLSFLVLLSLTFPVKAQLVYEGASTQSIGELLQPVAHEPEPLVINKEGPADILFVYGASNGPGRFASYFRTDLYIMSTGLGKSGKINFAMYTLPAGSTGNAQLQGEIFTIPVGGFGIISDVVGRAGLTGAATIVLVVDHSKSTSPSSCQYLTAWAKTYTAGPTGGEYATTLPVTSGYLLSSTSYVISTGIEQDSAKRTNVSIFNHNIATAVTVAVYIFDERGANIGQKDISAWPLSSAQISLTEFNIGPPGGSLRAILKSGSGQANVFAVTVDNITNDGELRMLSWNDMSTAN